MVMYPDMRQWRRRIDLESRNGIGTHDSVVMGRMCVELLWLAGLGNATRDHYRGQLTRPSAGRRHRWRRSGEIKIYRPKYQFRRPRGKLISVRQLYDCFFSRHRKKDVNRILKLSVH